MAKSSTNALTARYCAQKGWPCETVQTWRGTQRHDLFGYVDSIILTPPSQIWVQNCSYGTLKAHRDAIDELKPQRLQGVVIELWEWRKKRVGRKNLWFLRTQTLGGYGQCDEVQEWEGPFDLYPKKTKK